jgi:hypothetical protein
MRIRNALISHTGRPDLMLAAYLEQPPTATAGDGGGESHPDMALRVQAPADLTYVPYPPPGSSTHEGACARNGAQWTFPTSHPKSLDGKFGSNVLRRRPIYDDRWELATGVPNANANANANAINNENYINDINDVNNTVGGGGGHCPIDADPYLPWIHDAFPTDDGRHVEFVISNKRRCNTDPKIFGSDLINLEPQVALMQPVPLRRIVGMGGGVGGGE